MSKAMRRSLTAAARNGVINGGINISQNELGRMQSFYQETPILIVDRDESNSEILGNSEAGNTTSVYCVSFGDLLTVGLQNGGISVRDLGESSDKPAFVTRVEWYCGLASVSGRSVARLSGVDPTAPAIA
jgi:hypothetical protein